MSKLRLVLLLEDDESERSPTVSLTIVLTSVPSVAMRGLRSMASKTSPILRDIVSVFLPGYVTQERLHCHDIFQSSLKKHLGAHILDGK